jgi:hypothetical protein
MEREIIKNSCKMTFSILNFFLVRLSDTLQTKKDKQTKQTKRRVTALSLFFIIRTEVSLMDEEFIIGTSADAEYIPIDPTLFPYSFSVKLVDRTYQFTVRHNDEANLFTIDLASAQDEILCNGEPILYGNPLFESVSDERFPLSVIIPYCLTGDGIDTVTEDNLGVKVQLYLYSRV